MITYCTLPRQLRRHSESNRSPAASRNADIEGAIAAVANMPNRLPDNTTGVNVSLIVTLAARNRLPAVYTIKYHVRAGGLMSYGIVAADHYR